MGRNDCQAILSLAAAAALAFASSSPTVAKLATAADLTGKKFVGAMGTSALPGGKYSSPLIGDGTWAATANGVEIHAQKWSGMNI
jgi:hypothetical protein